MTRTIPRASAVLKKLEQNRGIRQEFHTSLDEVYKFSDKRFIQYVDRLYEAGRDIYWIRESTAGLMLYGIGNRANIVHSKKLEWIQHLWELRKDQKLSEALALLAREGVYLPPRKVVEWVVQSSESNKYLAHMLLAGDRRYYNAASTSELCNFLERSTVHYCGEHDVFRFRFFPMLLERLKEVRRSTTLYFSCIQVLAKAFYATGCFDEFNMQVLGDTIRKLNPKTRADIRSEVLKLLNNDATRHRAHRRHFLEFLAPATP